MKKTTLYGIPDKAKRAGIRELAQRPMGKRRSRVKSTDPRKPELLEAFKHLFAASRVTSVVEEKDGSFSANVFRFLRLDGRNGRYVPALPAGRARLRMRFDCIPHLAERVIE